MRGAWPRGSTDREVEVLRLVARGLSNKEIGARLFVSPKTVQRHLEGIFDKMGVRTRAGAAVCAVEEGVGELRDHASSFQPRGDVSGSSA